MQKFKVKFYKTNYVDYTETQDLIAEMEVRAIDHDVAYAIGESIAKNMEHENRFITIGVEEIE